AAGFGVQLASGANAITTAELVHAELDGLANSLPAGVEIAYSYETTPFVQLSIQKVIETLIEAIVLVFVVLLLFLQNLRATLIPMIAVPVVLLGPSACWRRSAIPSTCSPCSPWCWPSVSSSTTPSSWWRTSSASCAP